MKTRFKRLFGVTCVGTLLFSLLPGMSNLRAQNTKRALAECQEALETALIQLQAEKAGALRRARDDQEAVHVAAYYRIREQGMRENFVRKCIDGENPDIVRGEEFTNAFINFTSIGKDDEIGGQARTLLQADPRQLQDAADKLVQDTLKERSFNDAGRLAFFEMYLKGKSETVTETNGMSTGRARGRQPLPGGPLMTREVTLTNVVLLTPDILLTYLDTHPEPLKDLAEHKQKRLEFFGIIARQRAPLYAGAMQIKLGVPVTADAHFAKAMELLPPAPIGRGSARPNATLPKQLVEALRGAPESEERNHVVVELRHELDQRYGRTSEREFRRLITEEATAAYQAATNSGGLVNPFLARRLVDGWVAQAAELQEKSGPEMEVLKTSITQAMQGTVRGRDKVGAIVAKGEAGFENRSFRESLHEITGLDALAVFGIRREEPASIVLTIPQIAANAYANPGRALKILQEHLGSLPESNYKRQGVRDLLTRTPQYKRDYGAEMFMLTPKADRPEMAKYLLGPDVEADAALLAQGLRAGLDPGAACVQIKISRGVSAGALWERRAEAVVYYNGVLREDSAPLLDPQDAKMIRTREPRQPR